MTYPKRIQMSRQRPWRAAHPDAVIVARPSKWGNPFRAGTTIDTGHGDYFIADREDAVRLFANWLSNTVRPDGTYCDGRTDYFGAQASARPSIDSIRAELAGRDLACWCPLDQPCHANVLLRIANS
ncbi:MULTISPECIES: DUF4326 domain-containing protein [unclassified Microbacterium]|uniref:DUF4326 domain-containing protein n=1 Tax=unclassified Microbacterium TaxID=2609290 RepID=UPI003C2CF39D